MRFHLFLFVTCALILFSCSGPQQETNHDSAVITDSVPVTNYLPPQDSAPKDLIASGLHGDTIITADKALVMYTFDKKMNTNKHKVLSGKDARARFMPVDTSCDDEARYYLAKYFELDSLHKRGKEPVQDLGVIVKMEIKEYDTISSSPSHTWVAWTMYYESYPACPFSQGTFFMLSTYNAAGKLVSTQCMGRDCGGADAPMEWSTVQTCNLFMDGSFRGLYCDTAGDRSEEKPDLSIIRRTYTGSISEAGKITTVIKEIERNE